MAKVRVDQIVEHLGIQMQGTMRDVIKDLKLANVTEKDLLRSFQKSAKLRFGTWEQVPDSMVDSGY
jgi:hypothetical protein